jgi:hypothetical protein
MENVDESNDGNDLLNCSDSLADKALPTTTALGGE